MSLEHKLYENLAYNHTIHNFSKTKTQVNLYNTYKIINESHVFILHLPRECQPINRISNCIH